MGCEDEPQREQNQNADGDQHTEEQAPQQELCRPVSQVQLQLDELLLADLQEVPLDELAAAPGPPVPSSAESSAGSSLAERASEAASERTTPSTLHSTSATAGSLPGEIDAAAQEAERQQTTQEMHSDFLMVSPVDASRQSLPLPHAEPCVIGHRPGGAEHGERPSVATRVTNVLKECREIQSECAQQ